MPKLFLVGITPDHRGLVLSEHARAKRGDMVLEIDDRLLEAIDKANRLRTRDEGHRLESAALPTKWDDPNGDTGVARLTPREIQQRLRAGETVAALARSSGTDEAWIRRFATPVLAEQSKVVEQARGFTFTKRGVGPSGATLGPAVAANVIDRGVPLTLPDIEAGWGAYQHPSGGWHVTFTFLLRGRRQTAEWEIDLSARELTARNKLAGELAWREPGKKLPLPKPAKATAPRRTAARPEPAAPPKVAGDGSDAGPGPTQEPAPDSAAEPAPTKGKAAADETVQELPLRDAMPPAGLVPKAPPARKAPPRKTPESKAPAKRAAAAVTETPARQVVPVPPAGPSGSMPPTDLDVVDVFDELPPFDDDDVVGGSSVPVVEPGPDEEIVLVDEPERPAGAEAEVEEDDGPTGPISLRERPQPAPLGARPAPPGGPPAL
jgi:hypothetical protein